MNVAKLMERIKATERDLQALVDIRKENSDLVAANAKAQSKIKDMTTELKTAKRKLSDSETHAGSLQRRNYEYLSVFSSIQEKVSPILQKREKEREERKSEKDRSAS